MLWPLNSKMLDYELEFGIILGKGGKNIAKDKARAHIFGYLIFNDVSARDIQMREMQGQLGPTKGKDFDTGNILGPWLVTADEVPDPYNLTMVARVNGEEWSRGNSGTMHHKFEDMIAHVSADETLHAGEFFGSGTVGNGCGLEQGRFLKPNDVVELEIDGLGVLRNRFVKLASNKPGRNAMIRTRGVRRGETTRRTRSRARRPRHRPRARDRRSGTSSRASRSA